MSQIRVYCPKYERCPTGTIIFHIDNRCVQIAHDNGHVDCYTPSEWRLATWYESLLGYVWGVFR